MVPARFTPGTISKDSPQRSPPHWRETTTRPADRSTSAADNRNSRAPSATHLAAFPPPCARAPRPAAQTTATPRGKHHPSCSELHPTRGTPPPARQITETPRSDHHPRCSALYPHFSNPSTRSADNRKPCAATITFHSLTRPAQSPTSQVTKSVPRFSARGVQLEGHFSGNPHFRKSPPFNHLSLAYLSHFVRASPVFTATYPLSSHAGCSSRRRIPPTVHAPTRSIRWDARTRRTPCRWLAE